MKKFLIAISLGVIIFATNSQLAMADVMLPSFYKKSCKPGEVEITCEHKTRNIFGIPHYYSNCKKYENNPNYYYLKGKASFYGGVSIYCFKEASTKDSVQFYNQKIFEHLSQIVPAIFINLLLEIPIFLIILPRNKKSLLAILLANVISLTLFYTIMATLPFFSILLLILLEILVILFEGFFINKVTKFNNFKTLLKYSLLANLLSATIGSILLVELRNRTDLL